VTLHATKVYQAIADKLIARGVPPLQVKLWLFIDGTTQKTKTDLFYFPHLSSILNNLSPEVYTQKTHIKKVILRRDNSLCTVLPTLADSATYRGSGKTH
jgi:hypothetical protein